MVRDSEPGNSKILVIDNDPSVHATINRFLNCNPEQSEYLITPAETRLDGIQMAVNAEMSGKPYAIAFVGETGEADISSLDIIEKIRQDCPDMEIVALVPEMSDEIINSTAISSCSCQFLFLRKSFSAFEIRQLVHFLAEKWEYRNTVNHTYEKMCLDQNRRLVELESANLRLQQEIIIQGRKQEMFQNKFVRYRNLFDHADCPLIVTSGKRKHPAGKILDVNQRLCQLCDYSSAELKNMRFEDVFNSDKNATDSEPFLSGYFKTRADRNIPADIRSSSITIGRDSVVVSAAFVSVPSPIFQ